jgi:hypothetical protein
MANICYSISGKLVGDGPSFNINDGAHENICHNQGNFFSSKVSLLFFVSPLMYCFCIDFFLSISPFIDPDDERDSMDIIDRDVEGQGLFILFVYILFTIMAF